MVQDFWRTSEPFRRTRCGTGVLGTRRRKRKNNKQDNQRRTKNSKQKQQGNNKQATIKNNPNNKQ
jgi:hypothetical protein